MNSPRGPGEPQAGGRTRVKAAIGALVGIGYVTPPSPVRRRTVLGLVIAVSVTLWLVTLPWSPPPTYDTQWQLLWGEQLSRGDLPDYATGPTVHPLIVFLGGALSLLAFGHDEVVDQAMRALTALSLVSIAWMCGLIAHRVAGSVAALLVAILVLTRPFVFEFAFVSYFDVLFVALCLAGFLASRGGRYVSALSLLTAAGLIRPEAWLFAAAIAGALWWRGPRRIVLIVLAGAAPAIWLFFDLLVAGEPLYSFTNTSAAAEGLGRDRGPVDAVLLAPERAAQLVGPEVTALILVGVVVAWFRRRASPEAPWLAAMGVIGLGSYLAVNGLGTSVLSRYLLFPVMAAMPFMAFVVAELRSRHPAGSRRLSLGLAIAVGATCIVTASLGVKEIAAGFPTSKDEARADRAVRSAARLLGACRLVRTNDFFVVAVVARELDRSPEAVRLTSDSQAGRPLRTEMVGTGQRPSELHDGILVRDACTR